MSEQGSPLDPLILQKVERYEGWRKELQQSLSDNTSALDRNLLTLSTAMLGLSFAFLDNVVTLATAAHLLMLLYSWGLFLACISMTLINYWLSQFAYDDHVQVAKLPF